jgi:hypothetical protein
MVSRLLRLTAVKNGKSSRLFICFRNSARAARRLVKVIGVNCVMNHEYITFKDWELISCSVVDTSDEGWSIVKYSVQDPEGSRHELHQCQHEDDLAYVFLEQNLPRYIHESLVDRAKLRDVLVESRKSDGVEVDDAFLADWKYPILEMPEAKPSPNENG